MRHARLTRLTALGITSAALLLGACSDDDATVDGVDATEPAGGGGTTAPAGAAGDTITIEGFAFNALTVAAGSTVNVTNADSANHTVTSSDDAWDEVAVSGGESGSFTAPAEPGTYEYFCNVHGAASMSGTLTVE